jgi:hypothetical protein
VANYKEEDDAAFVEEERQGPLAFVEEGAKIVFIFARSTRIAYR